MGPARLNLVPQERLDTGGDFFRVAVAEAPGAFAVAPRNFLDDRRNLYHKPLLYAGLPSRLDKLPALTGKIVQDFEESFREEA